MNNNVFISLGSNLGDKLKNLQQARALINLHCGKIKQKSSIYKSPPWGYDSFNNYLNQVVEIQTALIADELLKSLLDIERELGRIREGQNYQDRLIDLDILFYGQSISKKENLILPHPRIPERLFILKPMAEINSDFIHPGLNRSIKQLFAETTDQTEVTRLA